MVNIGRPTLITLDVLTTVDGGEIKVIEGTANHYDHIGPKLLNDRYAERVDTIKSDERGKGERIIREIYKTWMREDVNCSWATLTVCFRGCGLNRLAHDIEQHFGLPSPPELPKGYFYFLPTFDCCSFFNIESQSNERDIRPRKQPTLPNRGMHTIML